MNYLDENYLDGLTEERLVALLNRWSKAPWRKTAEGLKKMDQLD